MEVELFLGCAKVETFLKDFRQLAEAIATHNSELTEEIWDRKCVRWISCINPNVKNCDEY